MQFVYSLINVALLAAIIYIVLGKSIRRMFVTRRETINRELDEAEEIERQNAAGVLREPRLVPLPTADDLPATGDDAQLAAELEKIRRDTLREREQLRSEMLSGLRQELVTAVVDTAKEHNAVDFWKAVTAANQNEQIARFIETTQETPGEALLEMEGQDVPVVLTVPSASPEQEALLRKAYPRSSVTVKEDPSLTGGFILRMGSTVFVSSLEEDGRTLAGTMASKPLQGNESADEILDSVHQAIRTLPTARSGQQGKVLRVSDGICWLDELSDVMYGEVVEFTTGDTGMVLDVRTDRVGCVIFNPPDRIETGTVARSTGRVASVPVGEELLGRLLDPMGRPLDGGAPPAATATRPIEWAPPPIPDRAPVARPLHTGWKAVDTMVPIGRGQRELIIGDRQTGKTALAIDAIINQRGDDTICVYVAIGQKETAIEEIRRRLKEEGMLDYSILVAAPASSPASMQYIAPFAATAMAEYFTYSGRDVLIVYDDLSKHAVAYRELSLLLQRPSGREAYPGDVFYLHSRLLERSAQLSGELGGGSLTALPIIETQAGDISAYIPTNVISITDGQIFLESELFNAGQRPAVNVGLSVSRVGGAAQTPLLKQSCGLLRMQLAQYRELSNFAQFDSDLDPETKRTLAIGECRMMALRQNCFEPREDWQQALLLLALDSPCAAGLTPDMVPAFEQKLYALLPEREPELTARLKTGRKLSAEEKTAVQQAVQRLTEDMFHADLA